MAIGYSGFYMIRDLNAHTLRLNTSAVKWLIAINRIQKIQVFVYIICVCTVYIYYVYINTHTYSIYWKYLHKLHIYMYKFIFTLFILYIYIYIYIYINIFNINNIFSEIYTCMCVYLYIHNKYTQYTHILLCEQKLLFWMRLIAINRLAALLNTLPFKRL